LDANSNHADVSRQLRSTTRLVRPEKCPALVDRVADENTGKRVKIETAVTEAGGGAAWFQHHGRIYRDHQQALPTQQSY
jgi:hypothetical protein